MSNIERIFEVRMKFRIIINQDEDGVYVAECPSLPGCISQGNTRKEAITNMQGAIEGYIESLKKHNEHSSLHLLTNSSL
jgi:antitoxin HicB